jgi:hypothetical protein
MKRRQSNEASLINHGNWAIGMSRKGGLLGMKEPSMSFTYRMTWYCFLRTDGQGRSRFSFDCRSFFHSCLFLATRFRQIVESQVTNMIFDHNLDPEDNVSDTMRQFQSVPDERNALHSTGTFCPS